MAERALAKIARLKREAKDLSRKLAKVERDARDSGLSTYLESQRNKLRANLAAIERDLKAIPW